MSSLLMRALLGVIATLGLGAGVARADCLLTIDPVQDQWVVPYDPFTSEAAQRQFDVLLANSGDSTCSGSARIDLRGEQFGLASIEDDERVPYVLIEDRAGADITPRAGQSARRLNRQAVNLAPGERALLRFTFAAVPRDVLSSGLYAQDAFLSIEDANGVPMGERALTLGLRVASAAVMGLKGEFQRSNGVARIGLGELKSGDKPLSASLYVLSTGGYRVTVRSENDGRLRLGASEWYVDYALAVGKEAMDLSTEDSFSVLSRRARADDYPLSVRIGDVTGKRAGDYSDVLTFTVAAL